jgi:pyruvate dehydrogenase E2 component (dihydrolipoamide acetyltransferase)
MRYVFQFPDIGEGIEEGTILEWFVRPGQAVKSGDLLVKVETDKVVADIPAPKEGVLVATFGREGELIHVGDPLAELELEGIDGAEAQQVAAAPPPPLKAQASVEEESFGVVGTLEVAGDRAVLSASVEGLSAEVPPSQERPRVLATPAVRAAARGLGLDLHQVRGTGPGGRVVEEDLRKHRAPVPGALEGMDPEVEYEPLTRIRRTIAKRMSASMENAVHMTLFWEVEVSELVALRSRHKARAAEAGVRLTYLPFVVRAVTASLREFPRLNSVLDLENDRVILKKHHHIGIAIDSEAGLTVPVIRDADRLSLLELARAIQAAAEKAHRRELALEELQDGTFTITNFGALGGSFGVPVINYPEVGILGVGRIAEKPVVREGVIRVGQVMPLSLSADHRLIDGGEAARFLQSVAARLGDPSSMLFD